MSWSEPTWFLVGLFVVAVTGAVLPIRVETREDHIVLTIVAAVAGGILGPRALVIVWGGVLVAAPLIMCWAFVMTRTGREHGRAAVGWPGRGLHSIAWTLMSAFAVTVGFVIANFVYSDLMDRQYPVLLTTTSDMAAAGLVVTISWVGTMSVRIVTLRRMTGSLIPHSLDPFDSVLIPYLLPLMGGFPLVTACVAMYRPADPFPALFYLWWCYPLYAATAFDMHRRRLAQELRRDALAQQRLAAIGEVSARIVHQSRHQVGLMGWSIHRLRGLVASDPPGDVAAVDHELDALAQAKDRLSEMLTSELLHEGDRLDEEGCGTTVDRSGGATVAEVVKDVAEQLRGEAEREGVRLEMVVAAGAGERAAPSQLHDVVFNLVDNAIDAAVSTVAVRLADGSPEGSVVIRVSDDGPGLASDAARAFEPFFTTKSDGTGMGLAIADALVGDLGGELCYERADDETSFLVVLPAM